MRIIGEIPHPQLKITLFNWNNKYLIKFEAGNYEQTYKVNEYDVAGEEALKNLVTEEFLDKVKETFKSMHSNLQKLLD
jgi:hypothetical protein